jgi:hypothetical protein
MNTQTGRSVARWNTTVGRRGALGGAFLLLLAVPAAAQDWVSYGDVKPAAHTVSPEVRSLPEAAGRVGQVVEIPIQRRPSFVPGGGPQAADPVLQTTTGSTLSTSSGTSFDGVSFNGYYPPDPNLSVSDTQIVQTTNVQFAVYDKTGIPLKGPVAINSLFSSLGGLCGSTNGGDPIVLWDKIQHRWLISQLAYTSNFNKNYVCVAVSQTADALDAFNLYAFSFSHLPDYPKFGVWSGSTSGSSDYYFSANIFSTALYYGPVVCAFNGADMQNGAATARFACKQGTTSLFSLLPADQDGWTPPAPGEANYFVELGTGISSTRGNTLVMFPFTVTWTSTGGSLNNPSGISIPVAQYSLACSNGGACVPQPNTSRQLDSLGDRLMYRLAFRKFSDHESLVVNHAVNQGNGVVGVRWYEIGSSTTLDQSPSAYQQGTFNGSDSNHRWMGSIAQDKVGNIALAYSVSSSSLYPSIRYTGRTPSDPLGTLGAENLIIAGTGAETGASRWGDYTSMSVDPADDCTFWYTNEYFLPNSSGGVAWNTRIASFLLSGCGTPKTSTSTSLGSSPNPSTFGQSVTFIATVTASSGSGTPTGTVAFLDGSTVLATATVDGGAQATYTTDALAVGSHSMTAVYGGDPNFSGSTSAMLTQTVNGVPGSFSLSSSPSSLSMARGSKGNSTITVTAAHGFTGNVSLTASGVPPQSSASFSPNPVAVVDASSVTSTLTITIGRKTPKKTYTVTITGSGGGLSATTTVSVTVQ